MSEQPDEARQRRLAALREIAGHAEQLSDVHPAMATGAPTPPPTGGRGRTLALAGLAAVVVIGLVAAGLALRRSGLGQPSAKAAPALTSKTYNVGADAQIYCPSTPAWSPDGKQFALFGQPNTPTDSCGPYNPSVSLAQTSGGSVAYATANQADGYTVGVFDAATGQMTWHITYPPLNSSTLCGGDQNCDTWDVEARSLSWSPDGRSVAFFFTFDKLTTQTPQTVQQVGVILLATVNSPDRARVLNGATAAIPAPTSNVSDFGTFLDAQRYTWNLSTGAATVTSIANAQPLAQSTDTIAFAPTYQLGADGSLTPGSGAISPWQSGVVFPPSSVPQLVNAPLAYRSSQWVWSTDGQWVTPNLDTSAFVGAGTIPQASGYTPPEASAPDAATSAAIGSSHASQVGAALAHSPDGKLLASYLCAPTGLGQLTIRASKSADPLAQAAYTYPSAVRSLGCVGDIDQLAWSPTSKQIAMVDAQDAQITIWKVNLHP